MSLVNPCGSAGLLCLGLRRAFGLTKVYWSASILLTSAKLGSGSGYNPEPVAEGGPVSLVSPLPLGLFSYIEQLFQQRRSPDVILWKYVGPHGL